MPPGTLYVGLALGSEVSAVTLRLPGQRRQMRQMSVITASTCSGAGSWTGEPDVVGAGSGGRAELVACHRGRGSSGSSDRARLFVAVWPPVAVVRALASLRGPDQPGVRWMGPEHWHVTLRFLGTVEVAPAVDALSRALRWARGSRGRRLDTCPPWPRAHRAPGRRSGSVGCGRRHRVRRPRPRSRAPSFRGHLTIARGTRSAAAGLRLAESLAWPVAAVSLVRSHLGGAAPLRRRRGRRAGPVLG